MTYNISSIDNTTGFDTWLGAVNSAANGVPAISVLILLFIGTFVYASNRNLNPAESFLASTFLGVIVSGLMYFGEITSLTVVIIHIVLFFLGTVYLMFK